MRILILGGDGMLGHQLFKHLREKHEVRVSLHRNLEFYQEFNLFDSACAYPEMDVRVTKRVREMIADFQPEAVVNGVGIVKQRQTAKENIPAIEINALFPHQAALICKEMGARLVHLSTDCVFSGKKGGYLETDPSDAEDLYGRTKYLGEVHDAHCVTLRTSIIGRELLRKTGLLEWFLAQRKSVKGFKRAVFSGFTTLELSRIIERLLVQHPEASGLYHISSPPINKYDLLTLIKEKFYLDIDIIPDEEMTCDRSLNSTKFRKKFLYSPPSWDTMIQELAKKN